MSQTATPDLLPIGAFSRRARLSVKALRLYDELALLRPARTDPDTGYRYYSNQQVERARLIGLLRRLDMPLQQIAAVLDMPTASAVLEIARYWAEVEESVAVKRRLVAYLERHLEGRGEHMYDVQTRDVPSQRVLTIQRALTVDGLPAFIDESHGRLVRHVEASGARRAGPLFVIYHGEVNADSDGPVEVCFPLGGDVAAGAGMTVRDEPEHREAFVTITRRQTDFPGILDAYAAVERWIQDNGHELVSAPREVYFTATDVAPDDPFCDVAFPYRP